METVSVIEAQSPARFTVGGVLSGAFSLMFHRFGLFICLSILTTLLAAIVSSLLTPVIYGWFPGSRLTVMSVPFPFVSWLGLLQVFIAGLCNSVLLGAYGWAVFRIDNGEKVTFARTAKVLFKNLHRVLGTGAVYSFLMTTSVFGFYIPVFFIACFLVASVPAAVTEELGIGASLKRSIDLTRGNRWKVLALVILAGIMSSAVQWTYLYIQSALINISPTVGGASLLSLNTIIWVSSVTVRVLTAFLSYVVYAVIYSRLRAAREGGVGGLARVFD